MPAVSDYAIVIDSAKKLQQGQPGTVNDPDWVYRFPVPANYRPNQKAVLNYLVGLSNANNLTYRVLVNGVQHFAWTWTGSADPATFQIYLPRHALNPGEENTAKFEITSGSGIVHLTTGVVHFQVNV